MGRGSDNEWGGTIKGIKRKNSGNNLKDFRRVLFIYFSSSFFFVLNHKLHALLYQYNSINHQQKNNFDNNL